MKRVVLSGVESVGKSRLAARLAERLGGVLVPEYGRHYTEILRRDLILEDHYAIAEGHALTADEAAATGPALLIEDTDIVMTTAWATMLFGAREPLLAAMPSRADLHLLLFPDVPFVKDKVRMFGDPAERLAFHRVVLDEFAARGLDYVPIEGGWRAREALAFQAVEALLS